MADKSVGELIAAQSVTPTDLFVLEQNGTAKKLTGQILENWLVSFADGHGGIQSIKKLSTSGLADTYRITLADTTKFDFVVTNGKGIKNINKKSTSGLVDTYTISYNDGTSGSFTVTNGAKGDKGDNAYIWIKYASRKPTESSHSMGDIPDDWIGIYSGNASTAPTDWQQYKWFKHKGEQGDTGSPATLVTKSVTYQVSDSGTIIPSGSWGSSIPVVSQGKYLWTKTEVRFNTGDPIVSYSVARMGIDGSGSVSSVAGVSPDAAGNVTLTAADVGALAVSGGDMTGAINMNGQPISGLNAPVEDTQAARKGYVDAAKAEANAYTDASVRKAAPRNLLDNSDFRNPVNQRGVSSASNNNYGIDRWTGIYTVSGKYIHNTGGMNQYIPEEKIVSGREYTVSICLEDGTVYSKSGTIVHGVTGWQVNTWFSDLFVGVQYISNQNAYIFRINVRNGTVYNIAWAALYEGKFTADTLPEYKPKGYGAELAECQRYFQKYNRIYNESTNGFVDYTLVHYVPMRVIPSVILYATYWNGNSWLEVTNISIEPFASTTRLKMNGTMNTVIVDYVMLSADL